MVQDPPYSDKVYNALKSKVEGFKLTPEEFNERIKDTVYQKKVYGALKSKVDGFQLTENDFYNRLKKKESTGGFTTPSPLLVQEPDPGPKDFLDQITYKPEEEPIVVGTIPVTPLDPSEQRAEKFLTDMDNKEAINLEQLTKQPTQMEQEIALMNDRRAKNTIGQFQEEITGKIEPQGTVTDITEDLKQVPPSFNKGIISVASTIPKGVAILAKKLDDLTGARSEGIEKYSTYQLGQWIEDKAKEIGITAVNDKRAGFMNSTVPMAFGQMMGMMLTGGVGNAQAGLVPQSIARQTVNTLTSPMAISGALQASVPEYEAAKAAGKSDEEAFGVFLKNIPGGMTEVIPIANMFSRLNKITGNGLLNALKLGTAQGLEEGSQEAVQQYLTNKIAQGTYDPKRDLKQGLLEGAGAGFIVGFLMPGIIGAMGKMTPEDKAETQKILDEVLKKGPEQTVTAPSEDLGVKPKVDEKPKEPSPKGGAATVPEVKEEEKLPIQGEQKVEGEKVVTGEAPVIKPETKSPEGQVQEGEISGKAEAGVSSTLDLKEISKSIKPEDLARFQQLSESLREGEMLLKDNIDPSGKKLTPEKRDQIVSSVESAKQKIQSLTNKGQEKISKGLESIATKIKPKVKEGVKTIKQLETENKKTFPKVPVKNVFSNDTEQPPREQRLKADKYIDEGTTATLPKQEIDVKDIVPTQKNLTIGNLEKTKDVKDSKEDIILLKHEGKFYVLDGHHRIANDILQGKNTIEANVYEDTKKADKGNQVPDTKSKTVKKVKSTKEVTYIKQELDGRVLYEDIDGNKYEARPTRGKKTNYDIYKNSKKLDQGAKKFADIPEVIQLNRESEKRASEPIEIPTDKTDYTKVPTAELKSNLDKENDFNKRAVMKAELDVRKKESDKIAQDSGFDNASHALNSIKKRTGKEYKTVQEVPDKVLESVANKRGYDKLEAKAKELTESIDQLKSENPNEFKKDGSLKSKSKITGTYKALVDMRQGVYDQMQGSFEEEFKKRGQEESEKSRLETEKINKEFEERANKDVDPEEVVFDEVNRIFGKIANEEQVTQEEVDYVNENAFLPKGFVFSESGLVKGGGQKLSKKEIDKESYEGIDTRGKYFAIIKDGEVMTSGSNPIAAKDPMPIKSLLDLAKKYQGKLFLSEKPIVSSEISTGDIMGYTFEQINSKQQGKGFGQTIQISINEGVDKIEVQQYDEYIKSKSSRKEEGKAKVAKGIEGIVNKIGGIAMVNPLDDTSIWEDVKNIIDGLADIGIAKSEEVIEYLKKEFAKLGIKESDVEEKRGEIVEYVEGKKPKEPEPPKPETKKESGRKKSLLNRAFEGTDDTELAESIKKHGLTYEPETWIHAKERAKAFVEEVGFDNALDAVRRNKIEGGSAAFVWSELIDSVGSELAEVTDEEQKQRLMKIESDLIDEFDRKAREGGRFISALQEVYASSDFGYKLDFQVEEYKKRNNGVIEPEVEERFKELDKQLTEAKAKRVEAEERAKKAEDELALQNIKESIAREKKQNTRSSQKIREAKNERAKLKSEFLSLFNPSKSGGKVTASVIPGATLAIYGVKIAKTYIKEGVARIEEIVAKTKEFFDKELGYKLSPDELELIQKKIEESVAETEEKEGIVRIPHKMIRAYVESGIDTIEGLVSAIKESIKDRHPNVTDREIRDVITGYGKTINPSKDEVEIKIRKMLRIGKIISALEDVANKKRPLRSGRQRDKLDAQERALNKELRSAMRDLPQDAETEAEQLKTSLDAVKTRLKNQIEELNLAIETGKKSAKAKGVEYDAEAKELAEQRDQIKEIYDAIFYKRDDDATKIENVLKSIEKAIEATIKKIETNDLEAKKQKKIDSPDIRAAKERLNRAKDRLLQLQEEAGIPAKRRLEATKQRLKNQIEDLKERLETGNYDRKKRPDPVTRDSELIKIDAEIAGLKEKFAKEQYKVELKNRTRAQKWIDAAIEIWGLTRALRATGEFSFVLIQNWVYTISHPITALRAIKTAFGHFFSEKKHEDFMNHLRAQDYYSRAKASKLAISETDVKLTAREEMFIGSYGNKLWDLLGYPLYPWKSAYEGWRSVNPLKAFERAGTGFLNTIRTTRYIEAEEMLRLQGRNFQEHPEDYKNAADVINTFTGRASLGWADRIAKPLAIVFFSPRNWASIIKQATPYAFYHFGKMNQKDGKVSVAQKMAMSDYLVAIGTTTAIVMLVDAMGGDDDEITVEKDPRSSDFMKIKIGNTRIDPWGGRQSMIVLQARLLMNSIKKESGQIQKLGQGQTSTGVELIGRIAKNKLSPSSSIAFKFFGRKTKIINGVEIWVDDYGNELYPDPESNLYPIYAETIKELYAEQPQMLAHLITFMSFWGLGTQTYDPQELKRKKYEYYQRVYDEVEAEKEGN